MCMSLFIYFRRFKFQNVVCNGCHDLTMLHLNISAIAIITVKGFDYRCIIHNISKSEAISLLEISVLEDRGYIQNACQRTQLLMSDLWPGIIHINTVKHLK